MKELFDKLYNKSEESFYEILEKNLSQNKKTFIVTANPETFMMSEKDEEMRKLLLDNDTFLVPDGIGIVKAARMINYDVKERITGIDIANELLKLGNKQKKSIYLFGAKQEVIDSMEKVLSLLPSLMNIYSIFLLLPKVSIQHSINGSIFFSSL